MQLLFYMASFSILSMSMGTHLKMRQTVDSPSSCGSACSTLDSESQSCDGDLSCQCTPTVRSVFQVCADCAASVSPGDIDTYQQEANSYVTDCQEAGFPIEPITVIASSSKTSGSEYTTSKPLSMFLVFLSISTASLLLGF